MGFGARRRRERKRDEGTVEDKRRADFASASNNRSTVLQGNGGRMTTREGGFVFCHISELKRKEIRMFWIWRGRKRRIENMLLLICLMNDKR
jgi:hypothetical protein